MKRLYTLRDYYFEDRPLEESVNRYKVVEEELQKTIDLFNKYKGIFHLL